MSGKQWGAWKCCFQGRCLCGQMDGAKSHRHKKRHHRVTGAGSSATIMTMFTPMTKSLTKGNTRKEESIRVDRECMARNTKFLTQWSGSREKSILLLPFILLHPRFIPCYDGTLIGCLSFPHPLTLEAPLQIHICFSSLLGDFKTHAS